MSKKSKTKQSIALNEALNKRGIATIEEHWDKHKHIDIFIPSAKIYIEVDGPQHLTDPRQIVRDFKRDHFSELEGFSTLHIPNSVIDKDVDEIAEAIAEVVEERAQES
jgi:very-short-patch-repair endonuclease